MEVRQYFNTIIPGIFTLLCLGGIVWLQLPQINQQQEKLSKEEYLKEEQQKKIRLDIINNMPNAGLSNLIADWVFLDFVQYYGDAPARELTGNTLSADYFETIVSKDPRFVIAYLYLAPATTLFAGQPDKTVELLSQGLDSITADLPQAYQLWTYKGIDQMLFFGDIQGAKESYEMGAKWGKIENTPTSITNGNRAAEIAKFLATNPDSKSVQISGWMMILNNARDEQTIQLAVSKLEQLGVEIIITPEKIQIKMPEAEEKNPSPPNPQI